MEKYRNLHLIKGLNIIGNGIIVNTLNKFFSKLSKSKGLKYTFLFGISLLLKVPIFLKYKLSKLQFKRKKKLSKQESQILRNLEGFGFSIRKNFLMEIKVLDEIIEYFYDGLYKNKKIINKNPMTYTPLKEEHTDILLEHIQKNYETAIAKYLFNMPYLKTICYMYSNNTESIDNSSQFWHLDKQGPRTLKIFIALQDLNESQGPLTFLDAFKTKYLVKLFRYSKTKNFKRISDESINNEFYDFNKLSEKFLEKKGSVAFLDTDRCLHFGSRKSCNSRLLLYIEYGSLLDYTIPNYKLNL